MSPQTKTILLRAVRGLGAVLLSFLAAWLVSPDALALIPASYEALVVAVVAPALLALEKLLRDGGDPNS